MISLKKEERNGVIILHIDSELDFEKTVWLRGELHELLKKDNHRIILDLSKVDFISSYTVGVFVAFARDLREKGDDMKFVNLQYRVLQTFKATRLDQILHLFDNTDEAIEAFDKPAIDIPQ